MLRITVHEDSRVRTIQLDGRIAGPWVAELHRVWQSLAPAIRSRELCLDLRGVTFADADGRRLLRDIYQQTNASFLANSPLTQHFADEASGKAAKNEWQGA